MRVAILGSVESVACQRLLNEFLAKQHDACLIPLEACLASINPLSENQWELSNGIAMQDFDLCLIRSIPPGSLQQVVFSMDFLGTLQKAGVRVVNSPKAIECSIDKYLTSARCQQLGLPVPQTVCCLTADVAIREFHQMGGNVVFKPIFGAEGRGVRLLTDAVTAEKLFHECEQNQEAIYFQSFIEGTGSDLRLIVVGGEVIGAIKRTCGDDFRTNCAITGEAERHIPNEDESNLAIQAADAVGAEFAGVDLIYDRDGICYVLEVNASPGWKHFERVTGVNVAEKFVSYLTSSHVSTVVRES